MLVSDAWRRIKRTQKPGFTCYSLRCMEKEKETEARIHLLVSGAWKRIRKQKPGFTC